MTAAEYDTHVDEITEPGMYDIPAEVYHQDPVKGGSLSHSGARLLLPPSAPAIFAWQRANARQPTEAMNFGSAAHAKILGVGAPLVVIDAKDYRTDKAKAAKAEALATGCTPVLAREMEIINAMCDALWQHKTAASLLGRSGGRHEVSLVWDDPATGITCRAMLDHLPDIDADGQLNVTDYKTCDSASYTAIARSATNYGYCSQDPWYRDGIKRLGIHPDPQFAFIFQEKQPPYLVNVVQLSYDFVAIGVRRNERAREIYRDCTESGIWPGHTQDPDEITIIEPPRWAAYESREGS